jgi:hypothetical protein
MPKTEKTAFFVGVQFHKLHFKEIRTDKGKIVLIFFFPQEMQGSNIYLEGARNEPKFKKRERN